MATGALCRARSSTSGPFHANCQLKATMVELRVPHAVLTGQQCLGRRHPKEEHRWRTCTALRLLQDRSRRVTAGSSVRLASMAAKQLREQARLASCGHAAASRRPAHDTGAGCALTSLYHCMQRRLKRVTVARDSGDAALGPAPPTQGLQP